MNTNSKRYFDDAETVVNPHSNRKKEDKYNRHTEVSYSNAELNSMAGKLKETKIDNKVIFGYVALDDKGNEVNCKYDKSTGLFIVYTDRYCNHSIKDWRTYSCDRAVEYMGEIR